MQLESRETGFPPRRIPGCSRTTPTPGLVVSSGRERHAYETIHALNELSAVEYPEDQALRARIRSYSWS